MVQERDFPYIWTTWLPNLLTGENSCEWAVWYKAHNKSWVKPPSDFDQAKWLMEHTALLNKERDQRKNDGYRVMTEGQNSFLLRGKTAVLAGKPDLVAIKENDAIVIDIKSGKEKPSHVAQVMIYIYALPRTRNSYKNYNITGEITYPNRSIPISETSEFSDKLTTLIRKAASPNPPDRVPSTYECRFCDILQCPDRMSDNQEIKETITEEF